MSAHVLRGTCSRCKGPCSYRARLCGECRNQNSRSTKFCSMCNTRFPRSEFLRPGGSMRTFCQPCTQEWHRAFSFRKKYGITVEEYDRRLKAQGYRCRICGVYKPDMFGKEALHVDHSHATRRVRGLLCFQCNSALGLFQDDFDILGMARLYLYENGEGH